jgi:hypothetical protein
MDIIVDKKGDLKIAEMNPVDDQGMSGDVMHRGTLFRGLMAQTRKRQPAEALAMAAGFMKAKGNMKLAEKLIQKAVTEFGGTDESVNAEGMYRKGHMFSKKAQTEQIDQKVVKFLQDIGMRAVSSVKAKAKPEDLSVRDVLNAIVANNDILPYFRKLAEGLLKSDSITKNKGFDAKVLALDKKGGLTSQYSSFTNTVHSVPDIRLILHELIHAIVDQYVPASVSIYSAGNGITGKTYKKKLEAYLKRKGGHPALKQVIKNYFIAIESLGLTDKVFGNNRMTTDGSGIVGVPYGLSSLDEWITESLTNPDLAETLSKIESEPARYSMRNLLASIMNWVKDVLFRSGDPARNMFDKNYNDIMMFIATGNGPRSKWAEKAMILHNHNLEPNEYNDSVTEIDMYQTDVAAKPIEIPTELAGKEVILVAKNRNGDDIEVSMKASSANDLLSKRSAILRKLIDCLTK